MNIFKKTAILIQILVPLAFFPTLSVADSWIDNVEINKDFEKLYFTQTRSAGGGTKTYIHFKTPSNRNVAFSKDSGAKRQTLFKFTDTGKKYKQGEFVYDFYLFKFENKIADISRCFYVGIDTPDFNFGFDIKISKEDFFPTKCKNPGTKDIPCVEVPIDQCL